MQITIKYIENKNASFNLVFDVEPKKKAAQMLKLEIGTSRINKIGGLIIFNKSRC